MQSYLPFENMLTPVKVIISVLNPGPAEPRYA